MMQNLTVIAYGIVGFAVLVTVGIVVIDKLGQATGGTSNTTAQSIIGYMGTSGLAGWIPAVIAVAIGVLFIALFSGKKAY